MKRLVVFCALALSACTVGPNYTRPTVPLADTYRAAPAAARVPGKWWAMFNDPALNALQEKALAGNLSIEAALARLDQANAAARWRAAEMLPAVAFDASASRARQSQNAGFGQLSRYAPLLDELTGLPPIGGLSRNVSNYQLGAEGSWELDFAGGLARQAQAARAEAHAAAAAVDAARLAVSAEVADAYLAYRGAAAEVRSLGDADAAARARVEIMAARVRLGSVPNTALDQARAAAAQVAAMLPPALALRESQANRIAVLIGQPPSTLVAELAVPAPIPLTDSFGAGVPADLLRHRPDLMMAEHKLIAANARIGAAMAEYYPRVTLSALLGLNSASLGNLFTGGSTAALGGGALRWRLFDFGRIDAEVKAARGQSREALADYRAAVLKASEEVESAFARSQAEADRTTALAVRRDSFAAAATSSDLALAKGAISRDANIAAHFALAIAESDLSKARADAGRAAIAARRALGN